MDSYRLLLSWWESYGNTIKNVLLLLVFSVVLIGSCVKRIDWREADKDRLSKSLCPEIHSLWVGCESDLTECHKDTTYAERR